MRKNQQSQITLIATIIILSFLSCTNDLTAPSHTNPFDPNNPETGGTGFHLTAITANGGITLEWTDPNFADIRSFKIYRSEQEHSGYEFIFQISVIYFKFTDTNLAPGPRYWYKVTAFNWYNKESGFSNAATVNINTEPVKVINCRQNLIKVNCDDLRK